MNITKIATAATFAAVLVLAGCSNGSTPETTPATPTVTSPAPVETVTPTEAPTVEPTEAPAPVVGDAVPATEVEELRAEGVSVYVSPNAGGEGVIVEPGVVLPEVVVNDIASNSTPAAPANKDEFAAHAEKVTAQSAEMKASGLSVLYIRYVGDYSFSGELTGSAYIVDAMNVANARDFFGSAGRTDAPTKEGAIAKAQGLIDSNPGITVVDLTN